MVGLLTALPHTRLARRLEAEGRLLGESEGGNTHDLRLNFLSRMELGTLLAGYKRVLTEVYSPARYFARCLGLLQALRPHPAAFRRIRLGESRALLRSILVQGFSSYARIYWRYLWMGLLANPRRIADLVTMAVKGHHYFQMTRNMLEVDRFRLNLEDLALAFEERARILSASGGPERWVELARYRTLVLDRMAKGYDRIHRDFRVHAERSAARLRARLDGAILRSSLFSMSESVRQGLASNSTRPGA